MSFFEHPEFWERLNDTEKIVALYSAALPLFELYDVVCDEDTPFERPDPAVIELCGRLKVAAFRPVIDWPPRYLSFMDFPYLEGNADDVRREWFECRPKFTKYLNELKSELIKREVDPNLHYNDVLLSAAFNHIHSRKQLKESKTRWQDHKQSKLNQLNSYPQNYYFKDDMYVMGDTNHVLRFHPGSLQGKIMKLLDEMKGNLIDSVIIARRTRLNVPAARRAITAIRSRLRRDKQLATRLKIANIKGKGYKLVPLPKNK